jgi:hypothetical protein
VLIQSQAWRRSREHAGERGLPHVQRVTPQVGAVEFDQVEDSHFVLVDFRYTNDVFGHIRLYEAGCTYAMRRGLTHAAAKRELVAAERPIDWMPPSIFRPPEVLTELETVEAENELKALQRHALAIVDPKT